MNDLKSVNVEKCFAVVNEFYDEVIVDDGNPELLSKKQEAEKALEQLEMLFKIGTDESDEDPNCAEGCAPSTQEG